ncbi:hypothetical protein [Kitasatospora sp. NPDC097643]|uniref:hypothetical protein n=1 Tax=Kitasatospora sp. NPDC097643 TaxID=3157230 RepID=UPI00332661DF
MRGHRVVDLFAFLAVLATTVALVALGVRPEQIGVVATALALLYGAWRRPGREE